MGHRTDVSKLQAGCIVHLENPLSSSGKVTHGHFFVVASMPDSPKVGDAILLVGVSSSIPRDALDPARHIAMKWLARRGGDPETGFTRPCHACVDFTNVLEIRREKKAAWKWKGSLTASLCARTSCRPLSHL